ncbi:type IV pilin protein [Sulfuriferula multivorans]|uniref:type IV pilin protein n=1 Tax=Sulfuriferula multivorans TaxID=1559896 RepID=UPI000F5C1893|nr:type IV pilin protein [Sulfuriferula multivorans]
MLTRKEIKNPVRVFSHNGGFTLIELMVVVAIVGLLAAIAYPSYTSYVQRAARGDAKGALTELSQFMERTYTENGTYTPGGSNPTLPYTQSPKTGTAKYTLSISASGTNTYTLQALPTGIMSGDACGNLSLDNTGAKTASGSLGSIACWSK